MKPRKNADRDARWLAVYETYSPQARDAYIDNEATKHHMSRASVLAAIRKEQRIRNERRKEHCCGEKDLPDGSTAGRKSV